MSFELNRKLAARPEPLPTDIAIDPVTADIIRGAFETVCFEAATHLGRAASSPIINQSNERNASIIDAHGRLAGISVGIPQLLFISPLAVRWGLENQEEDVAISDSEKGSMCNTCRARSIKFFLRIFPVDLKNVG